jgi:two-component system LytT family sensor kinase
LSSSGLVFIGLSRNYQLQIVLVGSFQWEYVSAFGIQALYGLLVSHFYKILFIRKSTFEKPVRAIWVKGLADTFNISLIITLIIIGPSIIQSWELMTDQILAVSIEILGRILNQGRYIVVWIIIYYMYKILERNRNILKEKLEMESLLTSTELELLKTQLNPHFLFNALNSIKALVLIDGQLAKDAIIKLSELLQFSLRYEKNTAYPNVRGDL